MECWNILGYFIGTCFILTGLIVDVYMSSAVTHNVSNGEKEFCPALTKAYRESLKDRRYLTRILGLNSDEEAGVLQAHTHCQKMFVSMLSNGFPPYFISEWILSALALHLWVSSAHKSDRVNRTAIRLVILLGFITYRFWTCWSANSAMSEFAVVCDKLFPKAEQPDRLHWCKMESTPSVNVDDGTHSDTKAMAAALFLLYSKYHFAFLYTYVAFMLLSEGIPVGQNIYANYYLSQYG